VDQLQAMRLFVNIADTQSFRRAAKQLAVSNALATRSIAMLEARLQTRLLNRTSRRVSLTEAGLRYLQGCRAVLEDLDHVEKSVVESAREPRGTLNILAADALSVLSLTPLLDGYRRRHPKVNVRLTLAERSMDMLKDSYESRYDVGLVTSTMVSDGELVQRLIGTHPLVMCAAPAYLASHGEPVTLDELASHSFVALQEGQHEVKWDITDAAGTSQPVLLRPVYTVNSAVMVRSAALAGMGIAILPSPFVDDELTAGALKRILQSHQIDDPEKNVSIVYPRRQYLPPKTSSFIDYTVQYFNRGKPVASAAGDYFSPYRYDPSED
jgi:DNA-binding transcriptional LysR family regulator